jgi:hypothetical protein
VPLDKLAQGPVFKPTVLWHYRNMKKEQRYLVWVSPVKTVILDTYEAAWRLAERVFENTGHAAFVEVIN